MYDDDRYHDYHVTCQNCRVAEIERHVKCVISLTVPGYTGDAVAYLHRLKGDVQTRVFGIVIARLSDDARYFKQVSQLRSQYRNSPKNNDDVKELS